ncbi:MAG: hypothetical protein WC337_11725 [Candidatus Muiribacteriota bacterium]|jgi:hypothetical protein
MEGILNNNKIIHMAELFKTEEQIEKVYRIDVKTNSVNLLYEPELLNLILTEIKLRSLILDEINIYAFCILPFHVSLVISMKEGEGEIDKWVKKFKAYITRNSSNKKLWKPKFGFEKIDLNMLNFICSEVVKQPESLGLVENWCDYSLSFKI